MDDLLSKAFDPHEYQSLNDRSASSPQRLKALGLIFFNRIRRGGLGLILRVTVVVFGIFVLVHLVPPHLSDRYRNVSSWSSKDRTKGADLRIVVFGSQDLAGSSIDAGSDRSTWPEELCRELGCSSLLSFVPTGDSQPGLTSNGVYRAELETLQKTAQEADILENPAADLFFIKEQYPVPEKTPDLGQQIEQFLSLAPPDFPPHETLWIFTFGTWDIWRLSAMPLESAEAVVDAFVAQIFNQVEILYGESLNEKSIAHSDFWSNATQSQVDELTDPEAPGKVDERRLESFRIIVPDLFDISLTPGWHARPLPPVPHSSAEQVRNAAVLTERWNSRIRSHMEAWAAKGSTKPGGTEGAEGQDVEDVGKKPINVPNVESEDTIYAPYPRRLGFHADPAGSILDAMTEEEMQRAGTKDSNGRGTLAADEPMRFLDVWTPCVTAPDGAVEGELAQSGGCDKPEDHLFHDSFTLGQRAIDELAKQTAQGVLEHLLSPERRSA